MSYKIDVVIEKDADGYYAYCPALKGCQTQGNTLEEVQANIKEAVELYLDDLQHRDDRAVFLNQAGVFADDETLEELQVKIDLDRRTNLVGD